MERCHGVLAAASQIFCQRVCPVKSPMFGGITSSPTSGECWPETRNIRRAQTARCRRFGRLSEERLCSRPPVRCETSRSRIRCKACRSSCSAAGCGGVPPNSHGHASSAVRSPAGLSTMGTFRIYPARAATCAYVPTRARGVCVCLSSDADGPVAPADPGRWCVRCSSDGTRGHARVNWAASRFTAASSSNGSMKIICL